MNPEANLAELGLELPPVPQPAGLYKPLLIVGDIVRVSGHGPLKADGACITGQVVDSEAGIEFGKAAARQAGLAILATIRDRLGSLDRIRRVIHLLGMVYAAPNFAEHQWMQRAFRRSFWRRQRSRHSKRSWRELSSRKNFRRN